VPRISADFLAQERRGLGESWFRQEYECAFEAVEGLVYPDFGRCVVPGPAPDGQKVGGMDFGFRNPFAAVWGVWARDGVLWLTGEHYGRNQPLSHHARFLPRKVTWYADPSGAMEISELRRAGFVMRGGYNAIRPGTMQVSARVESGRLRVLEGCCPHLLAEADLYRYSADPEDRRAEVPVDDHNHALSALRYLVSRLDAGKLGQAALAELKGEPVGEELGPPPRPPRPWLSIHNEELWTRIL
jgi:hypothetical protein